MPELTKDDIQIGKLYRGKKPKKIDGELWDDRIVLHIGRYTGNVQYDSYAVRDGRKYPTTTMEKFLKWASHEVPKEQT